MSACTQWIRGGQVKEHTARRLCAGECLCRPILWIGSSSFCAVSGSVLFLQLPCQMFSCPCIPRNLRYHVCISGRTVQAVSRSLYPRICPIPPKREIKYSAPILSAITFFTAYLSAMLVYSGLRSYSLSH